MSATEIQLEQPGRPRRADARRNYDKVVAAAREAFTEGGKDVSLEAIARRAGVGIGTLYRNFSGRQALLEAVYIGEVEELCRSAGSLDESDPWTALRTWLHGFIDYLATKQALAAELFEYVDAQAPVFRCCKTAMYAAGEPLLARAQAAGEARDDVSLEDVIFMVMGIGKMTISDRAQAERVLDMALDGLRRRPSGADRS